MSERAPIAEVLRRLEIEAKRRGGQWVARCPAHDDRDPSWRIVDRPGHEKHGFHSCMSCGFGGGLVALVAHAKDSSREWARKWLDDFAAGAPSPLGRSVRVECLPVGSREFRFPRGVDVAPLAEWVTPARRYAEERGITAEQVARWGIGYSAEGRLAGRIVVPIRRRGGALASWVARTFADAERRYLYPRSEEGPDGDAVWGEEHWPAPRERAGEILVVTEGAIDGLAVARANRAVSVAAFGGSNVPAFPMRVAALATFGRVVVLTDADAAGDRAWQDLRAGLARHSRIVRARLGAGIDAASAPPEVLERCLADAVVAIGRT